VGLKLHLESRWSQFATLKLVREWICSIRRYVSTIGGFPRFLVSFGLFYRSLFMYIGLFWQICRVSSATCLEHVLTQVCRVWEHTLQENAVKNMKLSDILHSPALCRCSSHTFSRRCGGCENTHHESMHSKMSDSLTLYTHLLATSARHVRMLLCRMWTYISRQHTE